MLFLVPNGILMVLDTELKRSGYIICPQLRGYPYLFIDLSQS